MDLWDERVQLDPYHPCTLTACQVSGGEELLCPLVGDAKEGTDVSHR